jgi:hypothetical protein
MIRFRREIIFVVGFCGSGMFAPLPSPTLFAPSPSPFVTPQVFIKDKYLF